MYPKFLEVANLLDESLIAESLSVFIKKVDAQLSEIGFVKADSIIQEILEQIVLKFPSDSNIRQKFNKASRGIKSRAIATRKLEALDELAEKNGSEKHTQAWLVNELKRIRSLEAKDRKKSALALIERLALNALPPGVCSTLENLYSSFSEERLKRSIAIIASSWK